MKELEVKVLNIDLMEMEERLKKIGARLIDKEVQVNTLIDTEDNFIENSLDAYMRIRETRSLLSGQVKLTLTMKQNINRDGVRENIETSTEISNKESMLDILKALGYVEKAEGTKERISYELNGVRFDIDKWDKKTYPYPYMEIEVNSESELQDIVEKLGIPRENISTKSIVELRREANLM
ncbi:MAG: class IV adenylate cyclase [Tissierellia bacterium]|mgnify:CR=1 FL=1|nr:class IV adenylate cyclase [Tissierellia bacterium]